MSWTDWGRWRRTIWLKLIFLIIRILTLIRLPIGLWRSSGKLGLEWPGRTSRDLARRSWRRPWPYFLCYLGNLEINIGSEVEDQKAERTAPNSHRISWKGDQRQSKTRESPEEEGWGPIVVAEEAAGAGEEKKWATKRNDKRQEGYEKGDIVEEGGGEKGGGCKGGGWELEIFFGWLMLTIFLISLYLKFISPFKNKRTPHTI